MYDGGLFCLLKILYDLMKNEAEFLSNVPNRINDLQAELQRMQCFLADADARKPEYETVRHCIADIKEVAYHVENIIEKYRHRIDSRKGKSVLKENIDIHNIGLETQKVMSRIDSIRGSMQTYVDTGIRVLCQGESSSAASGRSQWLTRSYSHLVDEDFVGLEDEVNMLVSQLTNERNDNNSHRVFAICGMGGLGKTTIARKVYRHNYVRNHFQAFAWVCISKQWEVRDVLESILAKLEPENRMEIDKMMDEQLIKELYNIQQSKKCLVVLDDVWSTNFWNSVKYAFPEGIEGSRILITTRKKDVCTHIDPTCLLYEPRCLDADESWTLLCRKAFPRINTPDSNFELKMLGKEMVSECGGLPLAIIVLARLLARRPRVDEWRRIHQNLDLHFEQDGEIHGVLASSYDDLPYRLKQCFLYLGNFPKDQEISARRLYQLWAADGIISLEGNQGEEISMMVAGEQNLRELAQRSMVQVQLEETGEQNPRELAQRDMVQVQLEETEEQNPGVLAQRYMVQVKLEETGEQNPLELAQRDMVQVQLEETGEQNPCVLAQRDTVQVQLVETGERNPPELAQRDTVQVQLEETGERNPCELAQRDMVQVQLEETGEQNPCELAQRDKVQVQLEETGERNPHELAQRDMVQVQLEETGERNPCVLAQRDMVQVQLEETGEQNPCELAQRDKVQVQLEETGERNPHELAQRDMVQVKLEETGERNPCVLAQRDMVQGQLEETTKRIKSCRLHDLMRDTCLSKAKEENFLKTVSHHQQHLHHQSICRSSSTKATSSRCTIHRLSITVGNDVENYFSPNDESFQNVRSALFFPICKEIAYPQPIFQGVCNNFRMLRVLHLEKFSFEGDLPKAFGNFVHLRYLSLRDSRLQKLPSSVGDLQYLQTLDLRVNFFSYMIMPNIICKLQNLRNLYLPPSHQKTYELQLSPLTNLEMLKNFDTHVSPFRDLLKLTKLQKLGAVFSLYLNEMEEIITYLAPRTGRLKETSFRVYYNFHSDKELNLLTRLLGCHHLCKLDLIGHISKLPEQHMFSQSLTKLTLRKSGLEEDPMLTLQNLPRLFTLSLRGGAFIGKVMCCSSQGFQLLKTLKIKGLPNLESWMVETGALPSLVHLEIDGCKKLKMVPDGLEYLTKLQEIAIIDMPETFKNRIQDVEGEDFHKVQHIPCRKIFDTKKSPKIKSKTPLSGVRQMLGGLLQTIYPSIVPKEWKRP